MCGIIGVLNSPETATEIFLGLENLQHRGQDGGGIITLDGGRFHQHRGIGLLETAFTPSHLARLTGTAGIGHTRYTTTGKKSLSQLQPFLSEMSGLVIAHNGNIVNYQQVCESFHLNGYEAIATGCDSEVILWTLERALATQGKTFEGLVNSVKTLSETLVGSYSVIGLCEGLGLFAFRDPNGLRPLVMGEQIRKDELEKTYAFASETAALAFLGFSDMVDIKPGELVLITPEGKVLRKTYTEPKPRHCMFEWVYFARVESDIDELPVYQARFNLGAALAESVRATGLKPDIVVPVPETSRIAAIALAEQLGVPFREVLIKNRYVNRTFILESQAARQAAIRRKLYPVATELQGKRILIVDDSIVRGNTAIQIIQMLRQSGAKEIYLASTCPPIQHPCYYGIDFPDENELLASAHNLEQLPKILGVDALIYQTVAGLEKSLKPGNLCMACLTGDYPTDISAAETYSKQRTLQRNEVMV